MISPDDDHMELGNSSWIIEKDGYRDRITGEFITLEGDVYNIDGELISRVDDDEQE